MEVIEHFELVLDPQAAPQWQEVEVVLQLVAGVGIGVGNAELVAVPTGKEAVAAKTDIKECRDRAGTLVGQRCLSEESPAVTPTSLDDVLTERVTDRPGSPLGLDGMEGRTGNDELLDRVERRVGLGGNRPADGMLR